MNNILHTPTPELKTAISNYIDIYDSDKRISNKLNFEQELKKLAWIQISSNALLESVRKDTRNFQAGVRAQDTFKPNNISNKKLSNLKVITNIAKNNNSNNNSGGFDELYSNSSADYKYRPNVIIESIGIEYTGDLGSIIKGNITLNCSTIQDFEIINEYYANPSVSLIVQWGYNTSNGLKNRLKTENDYSQMWKNPTKYKELMKSSNGDFGAILVRVTNISFTIDKSGSFIVNLTVMSRGVSEMFAKSIQNDNLKTSINLISEFLSNLPRKEPENEVYVSSADKAYVKAEYAKTNKIYDDMRRKYPFIVSYINDGFITLSAFLFLVNELLVDNTFFQFSDLMIVHNNFTMSNNLKQLKCNFENTLMTHYPEEWGFNLDCDVVNSIDNINFDKPLHRIDNIYLNTKKLIKILDGADKINDIISDVFSMIENNIIGDFQFKLNPNIDNVEFTNKFNNDKYIPMMLISESVYKIKTRMNNEKPLYIPSYGKNSIVSSFDISGSLQDGLAQTVLYSKQEEVGNTIGNLWNIKNDKYINYVRKEMYTNGILNNIKYHGIDKDDDKFGWATFGYSTGKIKDKNSVKNYSFTTKEKAWLNKWFLINGKMKESSADAFIEALFPLEINIDFLFGNTLFTYGTLFNVNYLPKQYKYDFEHSSKRNQPCFYIKSTSHEISGFSWRTKVTGALTLY